MKDKLIIGIDPGNNGGIVATLDSEIVFKFTTPTVKESVSKKGKLYTNVDHPILIEQLREIKDFSESYHLDVIVYIEHVYAMIFDTPMTAFGLGAAYSAAITAVIAVGLPKPIKVRPQKWQARMFRGVAEIKKKDGKGRDTKAMATVAANKILPEEKFLRTPKCRTPHDGLVDAFCIAMYAYYNHKL